MAKPKPTALVIVSEGGDAILTLQGEVESFNVDMLPIDEGAGTFKAGPEGHDTRF